MACRSARLPALDVLADAGPGCAASAGTPLRLQTLCPKRETLILRAVLRLALSSHGEPGTWELVVHSSHIAALTIGSGESTHGYTWPSNALASFARVNLRRAQRLQPCSARECREANRYRFPATRFVNTPNEFSDTAARANDYAVTADAKPSASRDAGRVGVDAH